MNVTNMQLIKKKNQTSRIN